MVSGLANGTPYTFTVVAHNSVGNGPASSASNPVTPVGGGLAVPPAGAGADPRLPAGAVEVGAYTTPWAGGVTRDVAVGGLAGVPADADAVVLNVTVTDTTGSSFLSDLADGCSPSRRCRASTGSAGRTIPNAVTVKLGTAGKISMFNLAGTVNVIADVAGYYATAPVTGSPLWPRRGSSTPVPATQVGVFSTPWTRGHDPGRGRGRAGRRAGRRRRGGVERDRHRHHRARRFLTMWPTGQTRPTASSLNWSAGITIPNAVTVKLGTAGKISMFNLAGNVNVIADVAGYYKSGTGKAFHPLKPGRVLDSRSPAPQVGALHHAVDRWRHP